MKSLNIGGLNHQIAVFFGPLPLDKKNTTMKSKTSKSLNKVNLCVPCLSLLVGVRDWSQESGAQIDMSDMENIFTIT